MFKRKLTKTIYLTVYYIYDIIVNNIGKEFQSFAENLTSEHLGEIIKSFVEKRN